MLSLCNLSDSSYLLSAALTERRDLSCSFEKIGITSLASLLPKVSVNDWWTNLAGIPRLNFCFIDSCVKWLTGWWRTFSRDTLWVCVEMYWTCTCFEIQSSRTMFLAGQWNPTYLNLTLFVPRASFTNSCITKSFCAITLAYEVTVLDVAWN